MARREARAASHIPHGSDLPQESGSPLAGNLRRHVGCSFSLPIVDDRDSEVAPGGHRPHRRQGAVIEVEAMRIRLTPLNPYLESRSE